MRICDVCKNIEDSSVKRYNLGVFGIDTRKGDGLYREIENLCLCIDLCADCEMAAVRANAHVYVKREFIEKAQRGRIDK